MLSNAGSPIKRYQKKQIFTLPRRYTHNFWVRGCIRIKENDFVTFTARKEYLYEGRASRYPETNYLSNMLFNYFLLALRNVKKQRGYSIINTLGLAIGATAIGFFPWYNISIPIRIGLPIGSKTRFYFTKGEYRWNDGVALAGYHLLQSCNYLRGYSYRVYSLVG